MSQSRRTFLVGSAGATLMVPTQGIAQQEMQPASTDGQGEPSFETASADIDVDAFGAIADCPRSGSTAGASDDSDAIEAALLACPDGGVLRFTPGACYLVTRPIHVLGKSVTVDARNAIIRCADDSVWHVFRLGGNAADSMVDEITVLGGVWDGNLSNQRYWPNSANGLIFTDRGLEGADTYRGEPFYQNSPVNGASWDVRWLRGTAGDGINVNGRGNDGLIRLQHTRRARFIRCRAQHYVRNGFVTWNCEASEFTHCSSEGQLPTAFSEMVGLFGQGWEAAFIKVAGENNSQRALQGNHCHSARVDGGRVIGGAMPFFMRIQNKKPISSGSYCHINGLEAYGISRELWFEDCASIRISNSNITCHPAHNSTHRSDPAIFFSNRTHDWVIANSYIRGRVNTNESQDRRFGVVESSIIDCDAPIEDWVVRCDRISNSIVRSAGAGAICNYAVNSEFYAERSASCYFRRSARGCRVGAPRFIGTTKTFRLEEGQIMFDLPAAPAGINHVRIRNPNVMGGRWFEVHHSRYVLDGSRIHFESGDGPYFSHFGDEIEVSFFNEGSDLAPFAGAYCGTPNGAPSDIDLTVDNTRAIGVRGDARITGEFRNIQDEVVFKICEPSNLELSTLNVFSCSGGVVGCRRNVETGRLVIRNCHFENWGLKSDSLLDPFRRPLSSVRVRELLQISQTVFMVSEVSEGNEASMAAGTNTGDLELLVEGGNTYTGGARPGNYSARREIRQSDFIEE